MNNDINKTLTSVYGLLSNNLAYAILTMKKELYELYIVNCLGIKQIIYSGPKTIVIWKDGSKTIVSCGEGDQYDEYAGFCAAITKKIFSSTSKAKKIMKQYIKERK